VPAGILANAQEAYKYSGVRHKEMLYQEAIDWLK